MDFVVCFYSWEWEEQSYSNGVKKSVRPLLLPLSMKRKMNISCEVGKRNALYTHLHPSIHTHIHIHMHAMVCIHMMNISCTDKKGLLEEIIDKQMYYVCVCPNMHADRSSG